MSYSKASSTANESNEEVIDIAGLPHVRKNEYYNPGNSAVTESM